jgi:hypothetical protein
MNHGDKEMWMGRTYGWTPDYGITNKMESEITILYNEDIKKPQTEK